eukprot:TRINITY_DN14149_c0_g1_i2.p1 TRINITY_DN14149_c0_g1~~TRINITY_DN14149_c0_g1_i2.p1  ORF type:complete len:213 (+),score=26.82 TRINITY_DN14149_c0_g1_i2:1-639(+)
MGLDGATTVSGTMFLAHACGIKVFVTGGIGGVHRGGESSMDVSADLTELGQTHVAVVCAGIKSILDIPRTLEYLETQGVCVMGYQCDEFPAFFSRSSGCRVPMRVDTPLQVAKILRSADKLKLKSGSVIAVPVPEAALVEGGIIEEAIQDSLSEAQQQGITGSSTTPFLLERVKEITEGKSLEVNVALIKNNALVGAQIANALSDEMRLSKL